MREQDSVGRRTVKGIIRRRLLVNALVDPDEATRYLPAALRPHVTDGGTVVGCCLLEIDCIRPVPLPAMMGRRLRAAAHRISTEWEDDSGVTTVGVYVPVRHTDSRAAVMLGGRWFPGVHRRAAIEVVEADDGLCWTVAPLDGDTGFGIRVVASTSLTDPSIAYEPIGGTCLSAAVGVSPDHHGILEAARMEPDHRRAQQVMIDHLESEFLAGFASAQPAPSYLMRDVAVTWTPAGAPRFAGAETLA